LNKETKNKEYLTKSNFENVILYKIASSPQPQTSSCVLGRLLLEKNS